MPDTRRFKTVGDLKAAVRAIVGNRIANHPNLSERLTKRIASALGGVAGIPFEILQEFPRQGSGGEVFRPGPHEFPYPDLDVGGPMPDFGGDAPLDPQAPIPPPTGAGVPANALAIVQAVRSHYPTPLGGSILGFLRETARALGPDAGLLAKTSGNNVSGYAVDIIMFRNGDHYDVLVNSEWDATPCWSYKGKKDPGLWRAP
jgi:hypothetical protein